MQVEAYNREPFQFRAQRQTVMVLHLLMPSHPQFLGLLQSKVNKAKKFFANAPIIIDAGGLSADSRELCLQDVVEVLREAGLCLVAVQSCDPSLEREVSLLGLPIFRDVALSSMPEKSKEPIKEKVEEVSEKEPKVVEKEVYQSALLIREPVRSGQRIYAENRDLICTATVSAGAELLADGSIHVYASLRGRAFAGVKGDLSTGIFCKSLEAELVSVAGVYRVSDQIEKSIYKQNVHIYLDSSALRVKVL